MEPALSNVTEAQPDVAPRASLEKPHIPALDGIRGLALLAVVAHHLLWSNSDTASPVQDFISRIFGSAWIGVDLFFALSTSCLKVFSSISMRLP